MKNPMNMSAMRASLKMEQERVSQMLVRINQLESEIERLTKSLENSAAMVNSRSREEGRLEGYRQRVREEDARTLGKMWHESFEKDSFGNVLLR